MTTFDLFSSVRDGNMDIVHHLLQSKQCRARLNERNEWGDTALHLSAEAGNAEICQMLIAAGASVTVRNNRGETCLHRAAVGGHVASVSAIVGRDQDPESVNSQNDAGYTSLHHAAKHGSKDLIEILVKAGADRLIENNAGETPYMVARKFDQILAERLLLDVEQHHAELAIREMNRKEKDIVRAYLRAVKQASHVESRVRLVLSGDKATGKSSLKKTMFGEPYDPREKPTSGIVADQSVTRITFKQYREWMQQPASKADTLRLNLEYIDSIIDFVLKFLRQPRVVQDEAIESMVLQIEKEAPKNVNFNLTDSIIPDQDRSVSTNGHPNETMENRSHISSPRPEGIRQTGVGSVIAGGDECSPEDNQSIASFDTPGVAQGKPDDSDPLIYEEQTEQSTDDDNESLSSLLGYEKLSAYIDLQGRDDDRLSRFAELADPDDNASSSTVSSSSSGHVSPILKTALSHPSFNTSKPTPAAVKPTGPKPIEPISTASLVFIRSQRELSRLLAEKIPLEILKRMVIRWPVGDEQFQDRSELNANRLTINVWDTAGDPLQQSFIPFFYSNRSVFAITYDLSKNLDAPCESYFAKDLKNVDGSIPTNAEVLENWISCALVHSKDVPTLSFKCTQKTPVLPPIIITCTNSDCPNAEECASRFINFFSRRSFQTYKKHLVESTAPIAVRVSNRYETLNNGCDNESETQYSGHHILRREIDYLARQMPYIQDEVPIQWVKFEQLLCDLKQQKKVVLLYDDLSKYITEHCQMSGPLRILPVLSQFHDVGTVVFFYRHPELSKLVITKPQWLLSSLGSIITSHPGTWITNEVKESFEKLSQSGVIGKDMVQLAYRCARMGQRYWNEMLFILNCMDLLCCHPSLHEKKAYYLPSMVMISAPDPFVIPIARDPVPICFSTGESALPIAIFNQLVVRCIRSSQYEATVYHKLAHVRLNATHHLLLWKENTSIVCLVQSGVDQFCQTCKSKDTMYEFSPSCSAISHLVGNQSDLMPSDNISRLMEMSTNSGVDPFMHLSFPDSAEFSHQGSQDGESVESLKRVCPKVLQFITKHLQFLCSCWFPGLDLQLQATVDSKLTALDQQWKHTVLQEDRAPRDVQLWFD